MMILFNLLNICLFVLLPSMDTQGIGQQKCRCGIVKNATRTKRIVGGNRVGPHEFPWFASIFYDYAYRCGGTIINDQYILTAGHCAYGNPEKMFVVVGTAEIIPRNRTNQFQVEYYLVHKRFQPQDHHHDIFDIGLIRLKEKLKFKIGKVWPVCLPSCRRNLDNWRGTIVGIKWKTVKNHKIGVIKKGYVTMMSTTDCKSSAVAKYINGSYDQIICARSELDDACQGDSGGPLFLPSNPTVQGGIISWGVDCKNPGYPGIYTNVRHFYKWIMRQTSNATYCRH